MFKSQHAAGTSKKEWGKLGLRLFPITGTKSYGDDPVGQYWIQQGINYHDNKN